MRKVIGALLTVVLICFGAGCANKQAQIEASNIELIKTILAEIDKGNIEIVLKLYAPDAKYYFPSGNPKPMSREDEVALSKVFLTAIPDMKHDITDIFAVDDKVVLRFVARGTHKAELEGIAPTGKKVEISALIIFRIKDGLVVEEIEEADILGLYQQLGMELRPKASAN